MQRLLIAVKSEVLSQALAEAFAGRFAVEVCHKGPEALALLRELHPEGVILDLSLPGMTGLEALEQAGCTPAAVLGLSNLVDDAVLGAARKAGVRAVARIPCSTGSIIRWFEMLLTQSAMLTGG